MCMGEWSISEIIYLLELFKKNDLWDNRATEMNEHFGMQHDKNFFTVQSCKRELHRIFSQPNPEHVHGLPTHPRSKEAAEMWLKFYKNELKKEEEQAKQKLWIGMRNIVNLIQKIKIGEYNVEHLVALRDQCKETTENSIHKETIENCLKNFMNKAKVEDLENITTLNDLLKFMRGEKVPLQTTQKNTNKPQISSAVPSVNNSKNFFLTKTVDGVPNVEFSATFNKSATNKAIEKVFSVYNTNVIKNIKLKKCALSSSPVKKNRLNKSLETSLSEESKTPISTRLRRLNASTSNTLLLNEPKKIKSKSPVLQSKPNQQEKNDNGMLARLRRNLNSVTPNSTITEELKEIKLNLNIKQEQKIFSETIALETNTKDFISSRLRRSGNVSQEEVKDIKSKSLSNNVKQLQQKKNEEKDKNVELILTRLRRVTTIPLTNQSNCQTPTNMLKPSTSTEEIKSTSQSQKIKQEAKDNSSANLTSRSRRSLHEPIINKKSYNSNDIISKQILLLIFNKIAAHRFSYIFYHPVSESDVPGYHDTIKQPLNLLKIKKAIESNTIETFAHLTNAIVLLFANAIMFNSTEHDVNAAAKELLQLSLKYINESQYPLGEFSDLN